jgi:Flp pilus assembly protein TadB
MFPDVDKRIIIGVIVAIVALFGMFYVFPCWVAPSVIVIAAAAGAVWWFKFRVPPPATP